MYWFFRIIFFIFIVSVTLYRVDTDENGTGSYRHRIDVGARICLRLTAHHLSEAGIKRLCRYIENNYARGENTLSQPLGPSLYGDGQFYLSRETYHAFNTCNVWTARALHEAGCPVTPAANLRVETLLTNVAKFGTVIQTRPRGLE